MAALEMVMSERLDEQGFEKFFADPPAALVVIKGLQKLAERKVLPGRALVQASRIAKGEAGMKNAESKSGIVPKPARFMSASLTVGWPLPGCS